MAYEYEKDILELLKDIEKERSLDLSKEIDEIQGTYQTARLIDNIVATTKKRLTEQERKAKAWDSLKELLMKEYPSVVHLADVSNGDDERGLMNKHEEVLEYMDELDGTDEFRNLLSDMEDK